MTKASDNDFPSVLLTEQSSAPSNPAAGKQRAYLRTSDHALVTVNSSGTVTPVGASASGSITSSGYTQTTARLLGRTTASTGAIEEITVGSGLSLSAGALTATGGSAGALVFLEAHSGAGATPIDFTSFISSTYDDYLFEFVDIVMSTTNALQVRCSVGGVFDTGSNYYTGQFAFSAAGSAASGPGTTTSLLLYPFQGRTFATTANTSVSGHFRFTNPQSSNWKLFTGEMNGIDSVSTVPQRLMFNGGYLATGTVDGVRFLASSGTITSGAFRVYGIAKS